MFNFTKKYEKLQDYDNETEPAPETIDSIRQHNSRRNKLRTILTTLFAGSLLGIGASMVWHAATETGSTHYVVQYQHGNDIVYSCGNSTAEAKRLGCIFDSLSMSWIHEQCHDYETTQAFEEAGPWHYYADRAGEHELTIEEVAMSADTGAGNWLTKQWHMTHCAFQWQKMHRAMINQDRRLEASLLGFGHTVHCGRVITIDRPRDELLTLITPQFQEC